MAIAPTSEPSAAAETTEACCPICFGTDWRTRKELKLYGVRVCKKCYYGLANRRQVAFLLDYILLIVGAYLAGMVVVLANPSPSDVTFVMVLGVAIGLAFNFLFALKDGFSGQSPGKMLMGVQVLQRRSLEPAGFLASLMRHIPLLVMWTVPAFMVFFPGIPWLVTNLIILILLLYMATQLCRGPRWGDKLAGTMVIWKKYRHRVPFDTRGALCVVCAYDLRGNVSGVCPECGTPIADPAAVPPAVPPGTAY